MANLTREQLLSEKPDILVIITDQERYHTHWPSGLRNQLMPSWSKLESQGLRFKRAYCSSSQCSPSRACMLTGEYSNINGVPTLPDDGMPTIASLPNIATVLGEAGYDVFWKGKWHLSFPVGFKGGPPSNEVWTEADIPALQQKYAMQQWNTPDAGNAAGAYTPSKTSDPTARAADLATAGGGNANNDGRYVTGHQSGTQETPGFGESALEQLGELAKTPRGQRKPFAMFVSLVNPHDITFFPDAWQDAGYSVSDATSTVVPLPPNMSDKLNKKPSVQKAYREALNSKSPFQGAGNTPQNYVNFYAQLHSVVEPQIEKLLSFLSSNSMMRSTVIVRTSDHGELGMSHGLREKSYTAYEEMIHVPFVISNPVLFPTAQQTEAFYSHVDLLPTLASIAQAKPVGVGKSMLPVMLDPTKSVQNSVLFAFDDNFLLASDTPGSHIRAIREGHWTYAVYYGAKGAPFEFELYNNKADPNQMNNLIKEVTPIVLAQWMKLHTQLVEKMKQSKATPKGFTFPPLPTTTSG